MGVHLSGGGEKFVQDKGVLLVPSVRQPSSTLAVAIRSPRRCLESIGGTLHRARWRRLGQKLPDTQSTLDDIFFVHLKKIHSNNALVLRHLEINLINEFTLVKALQ